MAKIKIYDEYKNEWYELDTDRPDEGGGGENDISCIINPFFEVPLTLLISITVDGDIKFRRWSWGGRGNTYLHLDNATFLKQINFKPSEKQNDAVAGLFSGRIKFDGLKLSPGETLQKVCPITPERIKREEKLLNKKIYLNR